MMEFMVIQAVCIALLFAFPQIATYLPQVLFDKPIAAEQSDSKDNSDRQSQGTLGIGGDDELEKGDGAAAPAANSSSKAMSNDLMKGDDLEKSDDLK
jgi:hypothetical protein